MAKKKEKKEKKAGKRMSKKELAALLIDFFHAKSSETLSMKYIFSELRLTTHPQKMLCVDILHDLLADDYISEIEKGKFRLTNHGTEMVGTFQRKSNGKNSFIPEGGGEPIFVAERNSAHAMNNDKVKITFYAKRKNREAEGEVIEILERANDTFVGTLEVAKSYAFLVTENRTLANDIFIPKDKLKGGKTGDKAIVKVTEWPDKAKNPIGQVIDILGQAGDNTTEMHAILAEFGLPYVYPKAVETAADKIPAEISAEEIQQEEEEQIQEDTKEVFGDGEAFMAEAGEVLQDASEITVAGVKYLWSMQPAEGYTQIGTTGVYVKAADGQTALTGKLYGTTTLSYSEFYAGDTTQESYDAITSATTSKNQIFTNEDSTEVTSSGYQIQGVKNVSVAVDAETYVDAQVLKAVSKLPKKGVYTEAADITLNEAPSQETGQYKTLNTDGTYSATKFDVKATVTDASAQIQAPSIWGDYMLVVKEVGTKYLRNSRQGDFAVGGNTLGVILETASGKKVGLRHTYEIWVQPYELAFSAGSGLIGEKISKVTYITPDGSYVYEFGDKAPLVKKQPEAGMKVQAAFVKENTTQVKVDDLDKYENPKVSVYYTTGRGHGKKTTYVVDHAAAENGVVTFDSSVARAGDEIYTVMISSDNYVDKYHTDRPADHGFQCFLLLGKGSSGWIYTDSGNGYLL